MTVQTGSAVLDPGTAPPARNVADHGAVLQILTIEVGPHAMDRNTAIGLMVTAIIAAHNQARPFDERDFTDLGFSKTQISDLGPVAMARAIERNPSIGRYFEVA